MYGYYSCTIEIICNRYHIIAMQVKFVKFQICTQICIARSDGTLFNVQYTYRCEVNPDLGHARFTICLQVKKNTTIFSVKLILLRAFITAKDLTYSLLLKRKIKTLLIREIK